MNINFDEIEMSSLSGEEYKLSSTNKPKVVNIWATWCSPCIREFPIFQECKDKYQDKVDFVMISDESIDKVEKYKAANSFDFNYLTTKKNFSTRPITYFVSDQGKVTNKMIGGLSKADLESEILALIKQ